MEEFCRKITNLKLRLSCARVGLKRTFAAMASHVLLLMVNMSFRKKSIYLLFIKPKYASNSMIISIVRTVSDASSFILKT
jgi:hypothetical protein